MCSGSHDGPARPGPRRVGPGPGAAAPLTASADQVQLKVVTLRPASDAGQLANMQGASSADGTAVIQYPWSGAANERWLATVEPDGYYRFASLASNKCLNVAGGVGAGRQLIQYTCTPGGSANDVWLPVYEPTNP